MVASKRFHGVTFLLLQVCEGVWINFYVAEIEELGLFSCEIGEREH